MASPHIQDGINTQVLSFCARVPELLSSSGLIKSPQSAYSNHEPGVVLLRIAEQSSTSLQPAQNFAIVERMFDAAMKHLASSIAEHEESKAVIHKLQSELARNKRDDLLRNWQDEAKRNSENFQGKIESLEQEVSRLNRSAKEFGTKVSLHRRLPHHAKFFVSHQQLLQESSLVLENHRLLEELRHARRSDARPASSSDVSALEAKLMLADATIMR
jgi:hypothetical protein